MNRLLRITLTWLLALALPVQGYAAQANLLRSVTHQATMSVQQTGMTPHQHQSHAHMQHAATAAQQDAECCDEHDAKAAAHGKCGSCASSCGVVAIATPKLSISVNAYVAALVATVALAHDRLYTGGIDRPPRLSLV